VRLSDAGADELPALCKKLKKASAAATKGMLPLRRGNLLTTSALGDLRIGNAVENCLPFVLRHDSARFCHGCDTIAFRFSFASEVSRCVGVCRACCSMKLVERSPRC
jgi:hypothetical protein